MIIVNDGGCMLKGQGISLVAELGVIVSALKENGIPEDIIRQGVDAGLMETSELEKELKKEMENPENVAKLLFRMTDIFGEERTGDFLRKKFKEDEGEK